VIENVFDKETIGEAMTARADVQEKMTKAAKLAGRKADDIQLIAISKTRSADEIRPLLAVGHTIFGENRVQESADKLNAYLLAQMSTTDKGTE
jgi:uncharacterized pyridoxal phosphate-containing UPF0001 family protein